MTDNAQAWTVYNSLMVDPLTHTVYSAGEEVHLPEMEYQLLYYFLQHTHTKKFHFPACPGVNQMNEKNKSFTDEPREELIARGYTPCGQCDP